MNRIHLRISKIRRVPIILTLRAVHWKTSTAWSHAPHHRTDRASTLDDCSSSAIAHPRERASNYAKSGCARLKRSYAHEYSGFRCLGRSVFVDVSGNDQCNSRTASIDRLGDRAIRNDFSVWPIATSMTMSSWSAIAALALSRLDASFFMDQLSMHEANPLE